MNAVETRALSKRYRGTWALRDCTLAVPSGHVVALVGPNGAGKTTLLHCVVGLARPTSGTVTVMDDMPAGSEQALGAVSFVAQNAPLLSHLTVEATISFTATLNDSFDTALVEARTEELALPLKRRVGRLSGGQQTQLALSLALARRPALLVLDEPLAPLDPLARHDFMGYLMAQVAEQRFSVVFSSHVVSELERVADYLIVLTEGRVQLAGGIDQLLEEHAHWSGPAEELGALEASVPVVYSEVAGRLARAVVRHAGTEPPWNWEDDPLDVEELVLAYLRTPQARALPGPRSPAAVRHRGPE